MLSVTCSNSGSAGRTIVYVLREYVECVLVRGVKLLRHGHDRRVSLYRISLSLKFVIFERGVT